MIIPLCAAAKGGAVRHSGVGGQCSEPLKSHKGALIPGAVFLIDGGAAASNFYGPSKLEKTHAP